ncbi:alpha/beta hydrolase [Salegentibacter sp. JZCK2]|uniref:alpha/beta hydrolase family protein n=1 Tax=Salegentibacter tibetensis TaxID=2873600 RepID=UPI001CC98F9D|nr:alpha/beta hydrolase [Salegentibacter tibetensis]MBZ9731087.1 alpha/beta hydrolase [Salegentibacter tibetensis]
MRNLKLSFILIFFGSATAFAQLTFTEEEITIDKFTDGTLVLSPIAENPPLVIFIQGSGPANRDGNSPEGMINKSDFAKKLAYELADKGIASFRFDKRSLKAKELNLESISFDDFVTDVENILGHFKNERNFSNLIVAGHSQGSLIGMLAAKDNADAFISIAGPGKSIEHILTEQLLAQLPTLKDDINKSLQEIKKNGSTAEYPKILGSLFSPPNQAFLASWMQHDPSEEIAKLKIPVLIIQGTRDLQVKEEQAEMLHKAAPNSELVMLKDMNHVFREIKEEEKDQNLASYNNPEKPLHPDVIPVLTDFIKNLENK